MLNTLPSSLLGAPTSAPKQVRRAPFERKHPKALDAFLPGVLAPLTAVFSSGNGRTGGMRRVKSIYQVLDLFMVCRSTRKMSRLFHRENVTPLPSPRSGGRRQPGLQGTLSGSFGPRSEALLAPGGWSGRLPQADPPADPPTAVLQLGREKRKYFSGRGVIFAVELGGDIFLVERQDLFMVLTSQPGSCISYSACPEDRATRGRDLSAGAGPEAGREAGFCLPPSAFFQLWAGKRKIRLGIKPPRPSKIRRRPSNWREGRGDLCDRPERRDKS